MVCRCSVTQVGLTDNDSDYDGYEWEVEREEKGKNAFQELLIAAAHEYALLGGRNVAMWLTYDLEAQNQCLATSLQAEISTETYHIMCRFHL